MNRFFALSAMIALGACAGEPPANTASGRPEVTIAGTESCVRNALSDAAVNSGASVRDSRPGRLIVGKPTASFATAFLMGSRFNPTPEERATITFIQTPDRRVRVIAETAIVTNPGTGFERVQPTRNGGDAAFLANLGPRIEGACRNYRF